MDYAAKAAAFTEALERTGSVEEALRFIDGHRKRRARRLTAEEVEGIRQMRRAGETLAAIGTAYGLDPGAVRYWCRDIHAPRRASSKEPHPHGLVILGAAGRAAGLPVRWYDNPRKGRRSSLFTAARRAAVLVMLEDGLSLGDVATVLGRSSTDARAIATLARVDRMAVTLRVAILSERHTHAQERSAA